MLDKIPLLGDPETAATEGEVVVVAPPPRRARKAVRRLHRNFRHLPKNALVQLLKLPEYQKNTSKLQRSTDAAFALLLSHPHH